jgi:ABC-2 type transport system ATP-binding protein
MDMSDQQQLMLQVEHLVKRYPKASSNSVDDVSFTIRKGEVFGLLGPNGAGKTTTIGILTTSVLSTAGTAYVAGINVNTYPTEVKRRIAIVPQLNNLDRSLKVREILTFHASYHRISRAEREKQADTLLKELGLNEHEKDDVSRYSGGMVQRLMLARALMHAPEVLFLDEPTNNLDPQSRLFLWDRIRALKKQGVTILLTTHDMNEADQLCDRIAIMDHGRILVLNTPDELKRMIAGSACLEVRVSVPELVPIDASTNGTHNRQGLNALSALDDVTKIEKISGPIKHNGPEAYTYRLYTEHTTSLVVDAMHAIVEASAELQDLRIIKPSLEDVFIYLTGRKLRV